MTGRPWKNASSRAPVSAARARCAHSRCGCRLRLRARAVNTRWRRSIESAVVDDRAAVRDRAILGQRCSSTNAASAASRPVRQRTPRYALSCKPATTPAASPTRIARADRRDSSSADWRWLRSSSMRVSTHFVFARRDASAPSADGSRGDAPATPCRRRPHRRAPPARRRFRPTAADRDRRAGSAARMASARFDELAHQRQVDHRRFVDDDEIGRERIRRVVAEMHRIGPAAEQPMQRARRIRHASRSAGSMRPCVTAARSFRAMLRKAARRPCRSALRATDAQRLATTRAAASTASTSTRATVVVLPVPGPPVSSTTRSICASAAASACLSGAFASDGNSAAIRSRNHSLPAQARRVAQRAKRVGELRFVLVIAAKRDRARRDTRGVRAAPSSTCTPIRAAAAPTRRVPAWAARAPARFRQTDRRHDRAARGCDRTPARGSRAPRRARPYRAFRVSPLEARAER